MSRKTVEVDSDMIDQSLEELSKLIIRLDKNPKKRGRSKTRLRKFKILGIRYRIRSYMRN
jgi:hypothetical protein